MSDRVSKWNNAAARFRGDHVVHFHQRHDVQQAAGDINTFTESDECRAAREMLAASRRRVVLARLQGSAANVVTFVLDEDGFGKLVEVGGMAAMAHRGQKPNRMECEPINLVEAVHKDENMNLEPGQILDYIKSELDKIAEQAPTTPTE